MEQLHWMGSWIFFWLHKTAAGAAVPRQVVNRRDPQEGSSKDHPGWEGGLGAGLGLLSSGEAQGRGGEQDQAGVSPCRIPQRECGRLWGHGRALNDHFD